MKHWFPLTRIALFVVTLVHGGCVTTGGYIQTGTSHSIQTSQSGSALQQSNGAAESMSYQSQSTSRQRVRSSSEWNLDYPR